VALIHRTLPPITEWKYVWPEPPVSTENFHALDSRECSRSTLLSNAMILNIWKERGDMQSLLAQQSSVSCLLLKLPGKEEEVAAREHEMVE
jgi:hypothetical protein